MTYFIRATFLLIPRRTITNPLRPKSYLLQSINQETRLSARMEFIMNSFDNFRRLQWKFFWTALMKRG